MTIRPKDLPNLEDLSAAELRSLVVSLLETVAQLEARVAALTEENAQLKGLKGRPNLKPSGMEKGTDPSPAASGKTDRPQRRPGPPKSARLIVDEDRVVPLSPQPGWQFKGFKVYTVQDLVVETCATGGRTTGRRRADWSSRRCRLKSRGTSARTWCAIC
jgi:hypothetical protein